MSLLLISPPVLYAPTWWSNRVASKPHLYSLAAFVRDLCEVRIVELDLGADQPLDLDGVELCGISCWTSLHYLGAVELAKKIRALRPDVPIVVGGHHPTAVPTDFVGDEQLFDFVVRGDGEYALRALVEERPSRPRCTRILDGRPYQMGDPGLIDWAHYPWHDPKQRILWLCFSRGCPFKCSYCAEPQRGTDWNNYSVADALGIIDSLTRTHQPRIICFSDPLFGARRQWTVELLEGIAARGLDTMFWCETRADLMTPALLDAFRACRFKVDFGLDTGSEIMARRMVKSPSPSAYLRRAREIIRHANAIELFHDTYVLFNFPGETPDTARETMTFIENIVDESSTISSWVSSQSFFILPGTETYRRMDEYRAEFGTEIRHPTWWREASDHNQLATDVLPSREWLGHEGELRDFKKWQDQINARRWARFSQSTSAFMRSFYGL